MAWKLFGSNWLTGIICMWHGLLVDIPNGWALCDGTNGTPDLRSTFVRGAPPGLDPGGEGGAAVHFHLVTGYTGWAGSDHTHDFSGITDVPAAGGNDVNDIDGSFGDYAHHLHEFNSITDEADDDHRHGIDVYAFYAGNLPPYYDIAYIMKL